VSEPIRKNVRIKEAAGAKQTIFEYAPSSLGAEDYQKLVERVHHGK
jgi:cellulose biosynthesis protein BcsQ